MDLFASDMIVTLVFPDLLFLFKCMIKIDTKVLGIFYEKDNSKLEEISRR